MNRLWKKASCVLLAAAMAATLCACGGNNNSSSSPESQKAPENSSSAASTGTVSAESEPASDEIVTLKVWGMTNATSNSDELKAVAEEASKITREKIGVEIDLDRQFDGEKLNLALASGEKLDLATTHPYSGGLESLVSAGYAMPLDDLFQQYGQDILTVVSEKYLNAERVNGVLYSIPNLKDGTRASGFAMRKDILDELGVDASTIKTWDDVHDVLVRVKNEKPDVYPLVPSWAGGGMQEILPFDAFGGTAGPAGLENVFEDSTKVVNLYETDSYKEFCQRMYQWNQEGLIMPDATTTTDNSLMSTVGFADYENIKPGKELEAKKAWGVDVVLVELLPAYSYTTIAAGSSLFIPSNCEYPEKAMQLWSLMFTDPELSNILINGVEGRHWEWTDDTKTMITFPEGKDTSNSGYETLDWAWPNCRITPVWEGGAPDLWDQLQTFCDEARPSPAFGFRFDSSKVMNELTACNNVISKYNTALRWGELNPDETLPQFNEELKAAGVETIVAEAQTQLDDWLAKNQ